MSGDPRRRLPRGQGSSWSPWTTGRPTGRGSASSRPSSAGPTSIAIDLEPRGENHGKRAAMAEGIRRASGEVLCFVDSDSYLEAQRRDRHRAAVRRRPGGRRRRPRLRPQRHGQLDHQDAAGPVLLGVPGDQGIKESLLSGHESPAPRAAAPHSGPLRSVLHFLDKWEFQTFLGRPATFGDDRALTNKILRRSARRVPVDRQGGDRGPGQPPACSSASSCAGSAAGPASRSSSGGSSGRKHPARRRSRPTSA